MPYYNKYRNVKTESNGIMFDSKKEAAYYELLLDRQKTGEVSNIRMQVKYELIPAVYEERIIRLKTKDRVEKHLIQRPITYIADFVFTDNSTGNDEVVDVKGGKSMITKEFLLKKKLMMYKYHIDVKIVM